MKPRGSWTEADCDWASSTEPGYEDRHFVRYLNGHQLAVARGTNGVFWYWFIDYRLGGRVPHFEVAKCIAENKARGDATAKRTTPTYGDEDKLPRKEPPCDCPN